MKAGPVDLSVSPLENPDIEFEGLEEDGRLSSGEVLEDVGTQLEVEEEPDHLRKLVDPKLPTQEKVEEHYLRGHVPYRNWCPMCIQARGGIWTTKRIRERRGNCPNTLGIIVSLGMSWVLNGRFWWEGSGEVSHGWQLPSPVRV